MQVQNGCDHRCTFCIIPYGRGPSRSVPAGEVVAQVRRLVEAGYAEIVLTGVDITSYGADLPGDMTLGKLVRHILRQVPELERLRLSSIDQVEADAHLIEAIAEEPRLMPHLHLSLQAGDDMILKRMKRRHARADAVRFCEEARRLRPDIVFGADLIAGFPTETEAMFDNSLRLVDDCGLTFLHVFPFSPRPGTPAARMPQVARGAVKERAARLRREGRCRARRATSVARSAARSSCWSSSDAPRAHAGSSRRWTLTRSAAAGRAGAAPASPVRRQALAGRAARPQVVPRERQACQIARPDGPVPPFRGAASSCAGERPKTDRRRNPSSPPAAEPEIAAEPPKKQGWFQRLKAGLTKTSARLSRRHRRHLHQAEARR